LIPTITQSGASVNPDTGVAHNFTTPQTYTVTAVDSSTQDYTVTVSFPRDYWWTWYDNLSTGALNWVLLGNPSSAAHSVKYKLFIGGAEQVLSNGGDVAPGASLTPRYPGVRNGPVDASSIVGGYSGIVSQRTLWAGNSLEEIVGTEKLSSHFFWPWYDDLSPGYSNWVMVANPGSTTVYYQISIEGAPVNGTGSSGSIAAGQSAFWRDATKRGGPVEVEAWGDALHLGPANVMASQRILSNNDTAFNELPGTALADRSNHYLWTWYDNIGAGGNNLLLISNPSDGPAFLYYKIKVGGTEKLSCSAAVPTNTTATWSEPGLRNGPVELWAYSDDTCTTFPEEKAIATQRIVWGPSMEEVPGYPYTALNSTYHWTWYDQLSAGSLNWVLVANPSASPVYYSLKVAGLEQASGSILANSNVTPTFTGLRAGPVEVQAWTDAGHTTPANIMASQRVLWNGFFNETLGTVLN
jgi:hypothetical protein